MSEAAIGRVAGWLAERGWAEGSAGNISVRLAEAMPAEGAEVALPVALPALAGASFVATGTGTRMRDVAAGGGAGLGRVRVADDGRSYRISAGPAPTSEFPTHLLLHDRLAAEGRPEVAVIHTHPTELIALTHVLADADSEAFTRALWAMHPEVKVFLPEGIGVVPYTLPGSFDLAHATVRAIAGRRIALWRMHGAVAVGRDPEAAFDLLEIANKAARMQLLCRAAGAPPRGLGPAEIDDLARAFGERPR